MKPETVEKWTHTIDTFKIVPRALILMWMYLTYTVIFWFMSYFMNIFAMFQICFKYFLLVYIPRLQILLVL